MRSEDRKENRHAEVRKNNKRRRNVNEGKSRMDRGGSGEWLIR
jgi:hypothetical protein